VGWSEVRWKYFHRRDKNPARKAFSSQLGTQTGRKKGYATDLTWLRLTVTLFLYLSPLNFVALGHLSIPGPIHSSTKAFDGRRFFFPDFVEIYEPTRSDGLADSLGGRASRPVRKIVPYVYLKPYTRRALLVTFLISIIPIYIATQIVSYVSPESLRRAAWNTAVNTVYKTFRILRYSSLTAICTTNEWLQLR